MARPSDRLRLFSGMRFLWLAASGLHIPLQIEMSPTPSSRAIPPLILAVPYPLSLLHSHPTGGALGYQCHCVSAWHTAHSTCTYTQKTSTMPLQASVSRSVKDHLNEDRHLAKWATHISYVWVQSASCVPTSSFLLR